MQLRIIKRLHAPDGNFVVLVSAAARIAPQFSTREV